MIYPTHKIILTNLLYPYNMKKIFFVLIFLLFFICSSVSAQTDTGILDNQILFSAYQTNGKLDYKKACESVKPNPKIVFYTSYGKLTYNTQYNQKNLTTLSKNNGIVEEGDLASGLALVDIASEYLLSTSCRNMTSGGYCIIPQELSVYIGFTNPVIYLANDLKPGTCLYNLVIRHEQVHQQINVNALEFFIPIIYKRIKQIVAQMKPMYVTSKSKTKAGTDQMTAFYAKQIDRLVEEFKQEILAEQRKLDNRQHYQYESEVCRRYNQKHKH